MAEQDRSAGRRARDLAFTILSGDEYGSAAGSRLTGRHFGALRSKQWAAFAAKRGLSYEAAPSPEAIAADPVLVGMFTGLREGNLPLHEVNGLMRGTWEGVEVVGFQTLEPAGDGDVRPYRFVCAPLGAAHPDLVCDWRLTAGGEAGSAWYPRRGDYREVSVAPPTAERKGLLGRTPVGKVLDGIFGPVPPKLHTADPASAERFFAAAYRQYDKRVFKHSWAVLGRWLAVFEAEGQTGMVDDGRRAAFMDAAALVGRLLGPR